MTKGKLTPLGDALAGAGGALFANTCVFPLDVIKTRLQVQNRTLSSVNPSQSYTSALDGFIKIFETEGFGGLYSGLAAGSFGTIFSSFSYFYWYSLIRGAYQRKNPSISTSMELLLGAMAGAMSQLFSLPIHVVTTRQQTAPKSERLSFIGTWKQIISEQGYTGLWNGLQPSLILTVNPAITYGMFERIKSILLTKKGRNPNLGLTSWEVFFIGALSKTLATIVTYPYIMAKVRLQWKPPKGTNLLNQKDQESLRYHSATDVLQKVIRSDGIFGIYKGMQAQIYKAVLSQAILFVIKEKLSLYTLFLINSIELLKKPRT